MVIHDVNILAGLWSDRWRATGNARSGTGYLCLSDPPGTTETAIQSTGKKESNTTAEIIQYNTMEKAFQNHQEKKRKTAIVVGSYCTSATVERNGAASEG